jgi:hypothetical protein
MGPKVGLESVVRRKGFCAYRKALLGQLAIFGSLSLSHKYGEESL